MLALISGRGGLPARVALAQAEPPLICVLEGFEPDQLAPDLTFRLEHLGTLLSELKKRRVTEVCFCGAIDRPSFDPAALDAATLPLVPVMMQALGSGDDGALRAAISVFESDGFLVRAAHDLAPDILAPAGILAGQEPSDHTLLDIERADAVLAALAPLDVGQGCVVGGGQVWGIETTGGTDHMLSTLPEAAKGAGAVLVKTPKAGQDLRADMPTVGPDTIAGLAAAGLVGLVVDAGAVILLEPAETVKRAEAAGLFRLGAWCALMRVFILAGEPSGDKLGAALMAGLKTLAPGITFDGIGGERMQAEGLHSRFPMQELSVMGLAEVLPKYRALKRRIAQTARWVIETQPDALITIDSPDFSFRVARQVKSESSVRTVHYVAPTVWAWRPKRAEKIAGFIDHLLVLFPFEPPYFEAHGMECDFVGHPVVAEPVATDAEVVAFRQAYGLGDAPVVLALPGSRAGEVKRLASVFGASVAPLADVIPDLHIVVPAALPVAEEVVQAVRNWPIQPHVLDPRSMSFEEAFAHKRAAFKTAVLALAASGTVSLELAAARTPMVIAYKMNWFSYQIIRHMALTDTVTLVNLVSETRVVPEFLGPDCQPQPISSALTSVWRAPEAQLQAMQTTLARLGEGQELPGLRAARAVLDRMQA